MDLKSEIYVSIPFSMLIESYLDSFIENKVNPEISFGSEALDRYSKNDYEDVAKELHSHGLSICLHAPYIDLCPGSPDPKVREVARFRFEQTIELIPIFKAKSIVFHTGFDEKRYYEVRDLWIKNSVEIWEYIAERLREYNVRLMLENVFERRPEDMISLINELRLYENIGICFDAAHANIFSIVPVRRWIMLLSPYIGELHLHNNSGNWDEHRGLDKGIIDFNEVLSLVAEKNKKPIITLEVHNDEEFWSSLEYLEKIWPWRER